jgi:integrase
MSVRKGWTTTNVALQLDLVGVVHDEVEIYHVDEVERMLRAAEEHDSELVPFLAVCAFAGLRPEREAFNLEWSDIHLEDDNPQIVVRPELTKAKRKCFVDVSDNLAAWLRTARDRTGRVFPGSFTTLRRKRQENRVKSNAGLVQDGLRHAYCSHWLAKNGDVNKLLLQSGHTSPDPLWRHYHRVVSAADAGQYWSIMPRFGPWELPQISAGPRHF